MMDTSNHCRATIYRGCAIFEQDEQDMTDEQVEIIERITQEMIAEGYLIQYIDQPFEVVRRFIAESGHESLERQLAEFKALCADKSGAIQRMKLVIAEMEAEIIEQCRLHGIGSEREASLMAQVAALTSRPSQYTHNERKTTLQRYTEAMEGSVGTEPDALERLRFF
jgi:hypothetical protein